MKPVLLVTCEFPPGPGGIGNHAHNLARHLSVAGHHVTVISEFRANYEPSYEEAFDKQQNYNIKRIIRAGNVIMRYLARFSGLRREAVAEKIIICSGMWPLLVYGTLRLFRLVSGQSIYIAHAVDVNPSNYFFRKFIWFLLNRFKLVVSVSSYTKTILPLFLQKKTQVITNGFDAEKLHLHPRNFETLGKPSLITVGSVTDRKGQNNVIEALPAIRKKFPQVHYHMVGVPAQMETFMRLAKAKNAEGCITFHGVLGDDKLSALVSGSDVFMMLSNATPDGDFEGFGIAVVEAAFLGVPSVGTSRSGIADAIKDGYSGFLVDPKNVEQVLNAVSRLYSDHDRFKINARNFASNFIWEKKIKEYITLFDRFFA